MRKLPPILILFVLALLLQGCALIESLEQSPSRSRSVTITRSAASDLGQVLIFARDKENQEIMFVKEFYSSIKSTDTMNHQMRRYSQNIQKLMNRRVTVVYHKNRAGNLVIDKITR